MKNKQKYKGLLYIFCTLFLLVISIMGGRGIFPAFADTSYYTSALTDLQKDGDFDTNKYPDISNDYSIQVIQVAESTGGELFVYTYQPCQKTTYLVATDINMSLTEKMGGIVTSELTDNDKPKLYGLTLINTSGVFGKYKVNDFTVSSEAVRYYNIASVYRKFNKDLGDTGSSTESILEKKAFEVGKLFIAKSKNGQIIYECQQKEVVQILNPFFDYLEYSNGFKLCPNWCRSHYIAFSTDKKIDFLIEADVSYVSVDCSRATGLGLDGSVTKKDPVPHELETINYEMTGENEADGWFSKKYVWDRIESVNDFIKNEDLKDSTKENLKGSQWVIRYTETTCSVVVGQYSTVSFWTDIESVTILRLKFMTNGIVYNLGAVSDMGHSDDNAGNNNTSELDFWGWLERLTGVPAWVWKLIIALLPFIILLPILSALFPVVGQFLLWIFKGLLFILTAPFIGIAWLIRKIRGDE